jgi:hypothetical protein
MEEFLLQSIKIASLFSSMIRKSYGIYISREKSLLVNYRGEIMNDVDVSKFDDKNLLNGYGDAPPPVLIGRSCHVVSLCNNVNYKDVGILTLAEFCDLFAATATATATKQVLPLRVRTISKIIHVGCPFDSAMYRFLKGEIWNLFSQGYALKLYDATEPFKAPSEGSECCLFDETGSRVVFFTWRRGKLVMLDGDYIAILIAIYKSVTMKHCSVQVTNETDLYHFMKGYFRGGAGAAGAPVLHITYDKDGYGTVGGSVSNAYYTFLHVQNALYEIPFKIWSQWSDINYKKKQRKIKNILNINERN